ncbi:hypothetical protein AZA_11327 [Nitrospirillum viridazoti Y2]|nr:hypothetical protein AZA_11327 [Nitrospirillum amazonense Y2]
MERGRVDGHDARIVAGKAVDEGGADAGQPALQRMANVRLATVALQPFAIDQIGRTDRRIAASIAAMAIPAACRGLEHHPAPVDPGLIIAAVAVGGAQEGDEIVRLRGRQRRQFLARIGYGPGVAWHIGQVPALGIAGADAVQHDLLYIARRVLPVEIIIVGHVRDGLERASLGIRAVARGAILREHFLPTLERGVA